AADRLARAAVASFLRQRLGDLRLEHALQILGADRADELVGDVTVAADDEGLRHAVDAPVDAGAAARILSGRRIRIAVAAEEAARVAGLVLVVDTDELDALVLRQRLEERHLVVARHAPRRPHVHERHLAGEGRVAQARHRLTGLLEAGDRRQVGRRRWLADQRRGDERGIAGTEADEEQRRQPHENGERQQQQDAAADFARRFSGRAHGVSSRRERRVTPWSSSSPSTRRSVAWSSTTHATMTATTKAVTA